MDITEFQQEYAYLASQATELLGCSVRVFHIGHDVESVFERHLILEERRGIGTEQATLHLRRGRPGHSMVAGMERFRLNVDGMVLRLVNIAIWQPRKQVNLWAVPREQFRMLYRFLRREIRQGLMVAIIPLILLGIEGKGRWNWEIISDSLPALKRQRAQRADCDAE